MTDPRAGRSSLTGEFSFSARIQSFRHALRGIRTLLATQHNAWIHLAATVATVTAGILFRISRLEWCLLVVAMVSVWAAEALNTALECLTDLVSPDYHPLAGRAKDVAAGAVLICAIGAVIVGALVFGPHLRRMLEAGS